MSRSTYLITRSLVALTAFIVFLWLFFVPPTIQAGGSDNSYRGCHSVGWNFLGDFYLMTGRFDVESPQKIKKYVEGANTSVRPEDDVVAPTIHEACKEARQGRSTLINAALAFFAVAFLSIPKPKLPREKPAE